MLLTKIKSLHVIFIILFADFLLFALFEQKNLVNAPEILITAIKIQLAAAIILVVEY